MIRRISNILPLIFCFILCLIAIHIKADDAYYLGDGFTVFPIESTNIQMVRESITIQGRFSVKVVIYFKNEGPATDVQMGFPFEWYPEDYDYYPSYKLTDEDIKKAVVDSGFKTWVDGKLVNVEARRGIAGKILEKDSPVCVFKVHFDAGETRKVVHKYEVGGEGTDIGDWGFTYILKTGALWKGPIEDMYITLILTPEESRQYIYIPKGYSAVREGSQIKVRWHYHNIEPDFNFYCGGCSTDPGSCIILNNILNMSRETLRSWGKLDYQFAINTLYAAAGYPFKDPLLRARYYYKGSPYHINKDFSVQDMSEKSRGAMDYLLKAEKWSDSILDAQKKGILKSTQDIICNPWSKCIYDRDNKRLFFINYEPHLVIALSEPDLKPLFSIDLTRTGLTDFRSENASISPNGRYLAFYCHGKRWSKEDKYHLYRSGKICILDLESRKAVYIIPTLAQMFESSLVFSPDSHSLATDYALYSIDKLKPVKIFADSDNMKGEKLFPHLSPSGAFVLHNRLANGMTRLIFRDATSGEILAKTAIPKDDPNHPFFLEGFKLSPSGEQLVGRMKDKIVFFKLDGFKLIRSGSFMMPAVVKECESVFGKDGWVFLETFNLGKLYRLRATVGKEMEVETINILSNRKFRITSYYNGGQILIGNRAWDIRTGKKIFPWYEVLDKRDKSNTIPIYGTTTIIIPDRKDPIYSNCCGHMWF